MLDIKNISNKHHLKERKEHKKKKTIDKWEGIFEQREDLVCDKEGNASQPFTRISSSHCSHCAH